MKLFLLMHTLLWHWYRSITFSGATFDLCWPEETVHLCLPSSSYLESERLLQLMHQPKVLNQRMLLGWCLVKSFGCSWLLKWWTCQAIRSVCFILSDDPIHLGWMKANEEGISSLWLKEAKLVLWSSSCWMVQRQLGPSGIFSRTAAPEQLQVWAHLFLNKPAFFWLHFSSWKWTIRQKDPGGQWFLCTTLTLHVNAG